MYGEKVKVLVVGDEPSGLAGLERRLSGEGFEIVTAIYQERDFEVADLSAEPDVVLLDLRFHKLHEFVVCERIRAADPGVVLIILADSDSEEDTLRGLDSGADDYVARPFSSEVLLARIRAGVRGRRAAAGERRIVEVGDLWIDVPNYAVRVKGRWVDLSPRAFGVLAALAQSLGEPLSRRELVLRTRGQWRNGPSRAVDVQISRIRSAVETLSDYTYIHTVRGRGYRFEPVPKGVPDRTPVSGRTVYR